jgi:hypothetical protein
VLKSSSFAEWTGQRWFLHITDYFCVAPLSSIPTVMQKAIFLEDLGFPLPATFKESIQNKDRTPW